MPAPLIAAAAGAAGRSGLGSALAQIFTGARPTGLGNALNALGGGTDKARTKLAGFADGAQKAGADLGFAIQGFSQFGSMVKGLGTTAVALLSPMTYVNEAFKVAGHGIQLLLTPLNSLNAVAQTITSVLGSVVESATGLGNSVKPFVDKANPAYSRLFEMAGNDLIASIGHSLIPVMQAGTAVTRAFADVIFALSPSMTRLMKAVFDPLTRVMPTLVTATGPLVAHFEQFAGTMAGLLGPAFEQLARVGAELAPALGELAPLLLEAISPFKDLFVGQMASALYMLAGAAKAAVLPLKLLTEVLGIKSQPRDIADRSMGAGVQNAQIGSVEEFHRSQMLSSAPFAQVLADSAPIRPEQRGAKAQMMTLLWEALFGLSESSPQ